MSGWGHVILSIHTRVTINLLGVLLGCWGIIVSLLQLNLEELLISLVKHLVCLVKLALNHLNMGMQCSLPSISLLDVSLELANLSLLLLDKGVLGGNIHLQLYQANITLGVVDKRPSGPLRHF